jgi:hypothetical protein
VNCGMLMVWFLVATEFVSSRMNTCFEIHGRPKINVP